MFQYAFCCNEDEEVTRISTLIPVDDGKVHIVNIRYVVFSFSSLINFGFSHLRRGQLTFSLLLENKMLLHCEGEKNIEKRGTFMISYLVIYKCCAKVLAHQVVLT